MPVERIRLSDRLGADSFATDKTSHLTIPDPTLCTTCALKPCITVCPAQVYSWQAGRIHIQYENCLELGACRVACHRIGNGALHWELPKAPKGVNFRFG
ncbi:MAG: 4Fe-4S dicluster domain-containing protein [Thermoplasmata archaeon]